MLLTHRSGLPNEAAFPDFVDRLNEPLTLRQNMQRLAAQSLEFEPGTRAAYSNSGYMALGVVVERVTGLEYHQFVDSPFCNRWARTRSKPPHRRRGQAGSPLASSWARRPGWYCPGRRSSSRTRSAAGR